MAQKPELIYNSSSNTISEGHFEECIKKSDYLTLLDSKSKNEKVFFEYFSYTQSVSNCNGIYFYRYVSKSTPQPLFRDKFGTYSRYFPFLLLDGKTISLVDKTEKKREQIYNKYKNKLEEYFGIKKVEEVKDELIKGYRNVY